MYLSRTICSRCASQFWPAHARSPAGAVLFSSLSEASSSPQLASSARRRSHGDRDGGNRDDSKAGKRDRGYFFSKSRRGLPKKPSGKDAVALFNDVVKQGTCVGPPKQPKASSPAEWEIVAKLKTLAEENIPVEEKVHVFKTTIRPHLEGHVGLPGLILASATHFLNKLCDETVGIGNARGSVALARMCSGIGNLETSLRNRLVLNICHSLLHQEHAAGGHDALLKELIDMWKHISQLRRVSVRNGSSRFILPQVNEVLRDIESSNTTDGPHVVFTHPTIRALTSIFLQLSRDDARNIVPGLLVTMAILSDPKHTTPAIQMEAAALLNLVASVFMGNDATESLVSSVFNDRVLFPEPKLVQLEAYVDSQWPAVMTMLQDGDAVWRRGLVSRVTSPSAHPGMIEKLHKRLSEAYQSGIKGVILSLWHDVKARLETNASFAERLRNEAEFLDEWVFVWCAHREGARLQETLDLMQRLQVWPTIRTYTNMMHGWKICKDTDKIEALWGKLAKPGTRLDPHIWTARISGLIEGGKPQAGIEALAEMQTLWKAAVGREAPHTAVQPSTEVVNAAFKGLIALDRRAAFEVLEWAGREQIEPDVRTYNILIRQSFRNNPPDDVRALLKTMVKQGIDPDEATFTIILEEVLGNMRDASAAEQVDAVQQVFGEIKAAGLRPNSQTYGKMMYAVANLADGAEAAINTVLSHMRQNKCYVTPHILTILIERAIQRDPSNIAAVRKLLADHGFTQISRGDQTLWERVMSAHAVAGDTAGALALFDELAQAGRPVTSLPCLADILRALIAAERREDAQWVVNVVLDHKHKSQGPTEGRYWRHHFWFLAMENGFLGPDDLPPLR